MKDLLDQAKLRRAKPLELAYALRKAHVVRFLLDPSVDPGDVPVNSAQDRNKVREMPARRGKGKEKKQRTKMRDRKGKVEVLGKGSMVRTGSSRGASDAENSGDGRETSGDGEQSVIKREARGRAKT